MRKSLLSRTLRASALGVGGVLGAATIVPLAGAPLPAPAAGALSSLRLFVMPSSRAAKQAQEWSKSRPTDAALMRYIAEQPVAAWFNGWSSNVRGAVADVADRASAQGSLPVMVAYNIPNRDCGSFAAGGVSDARKYGEWIGSFADGLRGRRALVILEPDAIAGSGCLSAAAREERFAMLRDAVKTLKDAGAFVYLDAGHASWIKADVMADRLRQAGIDRADGFSLNVSNFGSTASNIAFGNDLSRRVGGKHYVIDTSRNGLATANGEWCNPKGQALGTPPTTRTGNSLVDAFLWVKVPGESDGECNGGPHSGRWWPEYALGLAQRANVVAAN